MTLEDSETDNKCFFLVKLVRGTFLLFYFPKTSTEMEINKKHLKITNQYDVFITLFILCIINWIIYQSNCIYF